MHHFLLLACPILAGTPPPDPCPNTETDCRPDFEANAYIGVAIDSFAAPELNNYINPDVSGTIKERALAGFDFAFRVVGDRANPGKHQLWVYGKTEHGMRGADVDCSAPGNATLPICSSFLLSNLAALQPGTKFIYMLTNASTLEAYTGLRWEFPALQRTGGNSARPYLNLQFGFLTVTGSGAGVIGMHHAGLGLIATTGRLDRKSGCPTGPSRCR